MQQDKNKVECKFIEINMDSLIKQLIYMDI